MELFVSLGINALLEVLKDKKALPKWYRAIAKVYVTIEQVAATNSGLREAIDAKRALS